MNVEVKNGSDFLVITVEGGDTKLNPFQINIPEIRYMREYLDEQGQANGMAIFVGGKMFHSKVDVQSALGFTFENGKNVMIGNTEFFCVKGGSLTDRVFSYYLINTKKILYIRKFVQNGGNSDENNKFAVITVDERMIQIDKF
jgi:hypothetical protein